MTNYRYGGTGTVPFGGPHHTDLADSGEYHGFQAVIQLIESPIDRESESPPLLGLLPARAPHPCPHFRISTPAKSFVLSGPDLHSNGLAMAPKVSAA